MKKNKLGQSKSFKSGKPRPSANIILYWVENGEAYILVGKSCVIHYGALIQAKEEYFKEISTSLLKDLILGICKGAYKFAINGELEGVGCKKFDLDRNFNGILLSGLCLFPGGKQDHESPEDAACRELCEEFYLNLDKIEGGLKTIKNNLEFIIETKGPKKFYSLNLNALGLTADNIIQEFDARMKELGELSPELVWEKYKGPKDCPLFPEMREIIKVKLDEVSIKNAFCTADTNYAEKEITTFSNFLCDQAQINDQIILASFTKKMIAQKVYRKPKGGVYLEAANIFRKQFEEKQVSVFKTLTLN